MEIFGGDLDSKFLAGIGNRACAVVLYLFRGMECLMRHLCETIIFADLNSER